MSRCRATLARQSRTKTGSRTKFQRHSEDLNGSATRRPWKINEKTRVPRDSPSGVEKKQWEHQKSSIQVEEYGLNSMPPCIISFDSRFLGWKKTNRGKKRRWQHGNISPCNTWEAKVWRTLEHHMQLQTNLFWSPILRGCEQSYNTISQLFQCSRPLSKW